MQKLNLKEEILTVRWPNGVTWWIQLIAKASYKLVTESELTNQILASVGL